MEDAYLALIMDESLSLPTIDEDGVITNLRLRFRELIEVLANGYTDELAATLRGFTSSGEKIVTIDVVGYDKYKLTLLVTTEVPKHVEQS
ncbi:hypothetical protein AVT69_gp044 [Pseudomonas phage PhiPA3]|uniref:Uncharacterized protein 043 n=1 Tax=Pseudomonas phage PhiPA3 TaxID=998086 RepID=F8SJS5_BPPA3|nr:hypothetical protein AVT69_gp044 [Pseudomonas phage PhiPA3]AEH03470.1 hypothetical protein [Pseudomonas phage PhiPA3]